MILTLRKRELYGRILYYPINDTAKYLCEIIGTKTLADKDFELLRLIGFELEITYG